MKGVEIAVIAIAFSFLCAVVFIVGRKKLLRKSIEDSDSIPSPSIVFLESGNAVRYNGTNSNCPMAQSIKRAQDFRVRAKKTNSIRDTTNTDPGSIPSTAMGDRESFEQFSDEDWIRSPEEIEEANLENVV